MNTSTHEELGFWRKYVFSLDHKVIGIQYAITGLLFLLFGFTLMMLMRFQLAYPGQPIPLIGTWFGAANAPGGVMLPEFYNQLGAMHGTIMVFLGVVPLAVGGFGNYRDAAADRRARHGVPEAQHDELLGVLLRRRDRCSRASSCPAAPRSRAGRRIRRSPTSRRRPDDVAGRHDVPDHVVAARLGQLHRHDRAAAREGPDATCACRSSCGRSSSPSFLLLLAFPPLEAAGVLQLMDRVAGTSFFLPSGLVVSGKPLDASPAAAIRCCGSTCSGSSRIPRCTS